MTSFIPPRRKLLELFAMPVFAAFFYFVYPSLEAVVLFVFGFIWNWSASNDLSVLFENKRYRMSMLKLVVNLQSLVLKPLGKAPQAVKWLAKSLPAGIFWALVIYINESEMPWWATFLGSLSLELLILELNFIKRHREAP